VNGAFHGEEELSVTVQDIVRAMIVRISGDACLQEVMFKDANILLASVVVLCAPRFELQTAWFHVNQSIFQSMRAFCSSLTTNSPRTTQKNLFYARHNTPS